MKHAYFFSLFYKEHHMTLHRHSTNLKLKYPKALYVKLYHMCKAKYNKILQMCKQKFLPYNVLINNICF